MFPVLQYLNQQVPELTEKYRHSKQYPVSFNIPDCSILLRPRKAIRLKKWQALKGTSKSCVRRFTGAKEKYENQHERSEQGQLPRSKGDNKGGGRKGYE